MLDSAFRYGNAMRRESRLTVASSEAPGAAEENDPPVNETAKKGLTTYIARLTGELELPALLMCHQTPDRHALLLVIDLRASSPRMRNNPYYPEM